MTAEEKRSKLFIKLVMIPTVLGIIYLFTYLVNPFSKAWSDYSIISFEDLAIEMTSGLLLSWAIIELSIEISKRLNPWLPWSGFPLPRFFIQTVLIIFSIILLISLQHKICSLIYGEIFLTQQENLDLWQFFVMSIIVAVFVNAVHSGYFLLQRWKTSMSEAAELKIKTMELKEIAMEAELQSLKLQLDPHFMFNNFSTLSELINGDTPTAAEFLENLSRVYRYMIQNLKKNVVQLKDEISFVHAYFYLISIRYGENVRLVIELTSEELEKAIPPITLQLLIENAIKHNIATADFPLTIVIRSAIDPDHLLVSNNLQRISCTIPTSGMGLQNINDRYRILSGGIPEIKETEDTFTMVLPLLKF